MEGPTKSKKRKTALQQTSLKAAFDPRERVEAAKKLYVGKRLLLTAKFVYGKNIPSGERNYLFQYIVSDVNPDCKALTLDYEFKFIEEGVKQFKNYPEQNDEDQRLEDYRVELLKEDCELYRKYLAIVNKVKNDRLDEEISKAKQLKNDEAEVVEDIDRRILLEKEDAYEVLKDEFQPDGEPMDHVVGAGESKGQTTVKQQWSECSASCCFQTL
jgi:hypothetical protein